MLRCGLLTTLLGSGVARLSPAAGLGPVVALVAPGRVAVALGWLILMVAFIVVPVWSCGSSDRQGEATIIVKPPHGSAGAR